MPEIACVFKRNVYTFIQGNQVVGKRNWLKVQPVFQFKGEFNAEVFGEIKISWSLCV